MLTWEDEARLSDLIYAAKPLRAMAEQGEVLSAEQQRALDAGEKAIATLVVSHERLVRNLAFGVWHGAKSGSVDPDDLIQAGMIALMSCAWAFDARRRDDGLAKDSGTRFSVYSSMRVRRDMMRVARRGRLVVSDASATAERTIQRRKAANDLRQSLGREPTAEEVTEHSGIRPDQTDEVLLLPGASVENDDAYGHDQGFEDFLVADADAQECVEALYGVLRGVLPDEEADVFMAWMGLDRMGHQRNTIEVATHLSISRKLAGELIARAVARMRHPQNVVRVHTLAQRALAQVDDDTPGARRLQHSDVA